MHAAGIVISHEPLDEIMPLEKTTEGYICSGYPKVTDNFNLFKLDLLALRDLKVISDTIKLVNKNGNDFEITVIPSDDKPTLKMISACDTKGVSMFDSDGASRVIKEVQPLNIEDLSAIIALYRPAPIYMGVLDKFCEHKKHPGYIHSILEPILKNTYGTIVYQEQITQILQLFTGCSFSESDNLRRCICRKEESVIRNLRSNFTDYGAKHNIDKSISSKIFDEVVSVCSSTFNKSHSIAYALLAYRVAYLKCHYKDQFLMALGA